MKNKRRKGIEALRRRNGQLFLLPWSIGFILFFLFPLMQSVIYAFSEVNVGYGDVKTKFVDLYTGVGLPENKKSMTFTFVWCAQDHTLTGEEVEAEKVKLLDYLSSKGYTSRY